MRVLRLGAGLVVALLVHLLVVALFPDLSGIVDPFLLLIVWSAMDGSVLAATVLGCVAGLTEDAVSNGPFGLYGVAGTAVGYIAARSSMLVSLERPRFLAVLFSLAAILQQIVVLLLMVLLVTDGELPSMGALSLRIVFAGFMGAVMVTVLSHFGQRIRVWRRQRQPPIRMGFRE